MNNPWNILIVGDGIGAHSVNEGSALRVVDALQAVGVDCRCPVVSVEKRIGQTAKRRTVLVPRWAGYIFARISDAPRIARIKGIRGWYIVDGDFARVSVATVADLMQRYDERTIAEPVRVLYEPGDEVRITFGPLKGYVVPVTDVDGETLTILSPLAHGMGATISARRVEKA